MFKRRTRSTKRSIAILLTFVLSFSTCAQSVFALGEQWQGTTKGDVVVKDTVTKLANSVYEHEVITNNQSGTEQKIDYLCEIGKSKDIKIVAGYGQDDASSWSLTPTTKQASAYEKKHPGETVVAGINADFFNMANGQPQGALVMEGKVYNNANGRPYFGITKEGNPVIRQDSNLSDLETAVGGDVILVSNGVPIKENTSYGAIKYSRTAIGIKADGTVVTFVTHGLNAPISCGRTYTAIAEMLANEGCVSALALDGGGSSTYAGRPEGTDKLEVRNNPADGAERAVSSSLLIVSTAEPTGEFSHVQITPNNEVYTPGSEVQFEAKGVDTAGIAMPLPDGVKWELADNSKNLGTINPDTGIFTAGSNIGVVTVNMVYQDKVVGETKIEVAVPDHIYFGTDEISLGFEDKSDLGIVVRNKGRDMNYKVGDIKWTISDPKMGKFEGNTFISADGVSLNGDVIATSAYDENVSGKIKVIVGKLPTVVWDFENIENHDGTVIPAQEYYIGTTDKAGILSTSNYGRGGVQSIEIATSDNDEPVRFGENSLKLNYDFRNCGEVTEGACIGTTDSLIIPGVPTGIGVWVYAPEGVGIEYKGDGSQAGFWLRGYVRDAAGNNKPYDFTLEPKNPNVTSGKEQPGIYWEGWKYLEADLTQLQAPFSIQPGMTMRLMYVAGTKMGTKTANSIYFDNLQFVYGANMDDIDDPYVASMQINGADFTDDMVVKTDTITIDAMLKDKDGKYATGIDDKTVRMYVDGINVVDNDKYTYVYSAGDDRAQLSNLKLKNGKHSITVKAKDGFGNEVNQTKYFTVDTGSTAEGTTVKVVSATDKAVIGKTIDLKIVASDDTVVESATTFKLGNQFKNYKVTYGDNYEGTDFFNKLEKTITINAKRKTESPVGILAKLLDKETTIATLSIEVPTDMKEDDAVNYIVKGGKFETSSGEYATYSNSEIKVPVGANYQISTDTVIIGGNPAEIKVTDASDKPAKDVTLYMSGTNDVIGKTDKNGVLKTDQFNTEGTEAKDYVIYAKDDKGGLSFEYKLSVFKAEGDSNGAAYNVRFNTVKKADSQKNITWFSNPLDNKKQVLKYRVHGTTDWITVDASAKNLTFNTSGNSTVNVNSIMLDNLKANTTYDYVVGAEESLSAEATFKTGETGKKTNEFFIIGDIQDPDKSRVQEVAKQLDVQNNNYDFGIQIGDAIDQAANYKDWNDLGEVLGAKMLGGTNMINIMGNHEYYGDANASIPAAIYNSKDTKEGAYYSLEYNDVYIAVINFSNTATPIKEAADWLVEDAAKSKATWKILCMHQPAYYTNEGGNAPVYKYIPDAAEKTGIDAVFSGHDHSWAVTNPLINDQIDEENGIRYYIVGAAGSKRYSASTQDKFDYNTIFKKVGEPFDATYLKVASNEDEMTINVYDINQGLLDTVVIQSECKKNGHDNVYNPENGELSCKTCGRVTENYTGDVYDENGKEYYMLAGNIQKDWVTVGTEIRYYDKNGVREKVTVYDVPSTCIIDGFCIYTSESGATKRIDKIDAGGHDIEVVDKKHICQKCGWQQFDMSEVAVSLSTNIYTYNGVAKTPYTTATDPNGNVLTKRPASYPDYYSTYKNNVEVGTATVTLTAAKYGTYVDMTSWRGNYRNSITVKYEIRPNAPTNALVKRVENGKYILTWDKAQYEKESVDDYVIYESINGGEWKELGTTKNSEFEISVNPKNKYEYRVASRKVAKDKKTYESAKYATAKTLSLDVKASYRESDEKPTLSWNANKGAKYVVLRSTKPETGYEAVFTTTGTTYTHVSAVPGRTYYYKVEASANGDKCTSPYVTVTCPLKSPVLNNIEFNNDGNPHLTWSTVNGAASYDVYRADSKDGDFIIAGTVKDESFTDKSAEAGKTYFYKVTAKYKDVKSDSDVVSITCPIEAPVLEKVTYNEEGKPVLKWNSADGAASYKVYKSESKDGAFTEVSPITNTEFTDINAEPDKVYYYKVEAINGELVAVSEIVKAVCSIDKPVIEKAVLNNDAKPELSWNTIIGAVEYKVYRSESKDGKYTEVTSTKETSFTDAKAEAAKTYYYKIEALGENTKSKSEVTTITSGIKSVVIEKAELNENGKPSLKWNKVEGATLYKVYKSESLNEEFIETFKTKGVTYTNTGAKPGHKYFYKVEASGNGVASMSEIVSVVCPIKAPTAEFKGLDNNGRPMIKWNAVDCATKYEVYRANAKSNEFVKLANVDGLAYTDNSAAELTDYEYKVRAVGFNTEIYADSETIIAKSGELALAVTRLDGSDRFETAIKAAEEFKAVKGINKFENVIVASGLNYADALAGGYLAKVKNAPILLVNASTESYVADYISKNMSSLGTVYILGGHNAVPASLEGKLKGLNTTRLGGTDRYETNIMILKAANVNNEEVLVCTAVDFADSLSASAAGRPILLVGNKLDAKQSAYLKTITAKNYTIIGGTTAVGTEVANEIKTFGAVDRIQGADRYITSKAIADRYFQEGSKALVVASGINFPDGLAGTPVAMSMTSPIILVNQGYVDAANSYLADYNIKNLVVIGGVNAVPESVVSEIIG